jgi:hypothetical protein
MFYNISDQCFALFQSNVSVCFRAMMWRVSVSVQYLVLSILLLLVLTESRPRYADTRSSSSSSSSSLSSPSSLTHNTPSHSSHSSSHSAHSRPKRQLFSFNTNLSALESWLAARQSRRHGAAQAYLAAIGKRDAGSGLSVALSVEAIKDMMRAQHRRTSRDRARDAASRLQLIGK